MSNKRKTAFKNCEAIVFNPKWEVDVRHPLKRNQIVYFLGEIPNVPGHCVVVTWDGKVVPMVHPGDFRKAKDEEL